MKFDRSANDVVGKLMSTGMRKQILGAGVAAVALWPLSAAAHVAGHAHGHGMADSFVNAFIHPFAGADHLAAMLAVGAFSSLMAHAAWRVLAAFAAMLIAGALAGIGGVWMGAVEPMIAASVLLLGLLIAVRKQIPWEFAASLSAGFAFFHGVAHGHELASDARLLSLAALVGLALGSAVLLSLGVALGRAMERRTQWMARWAGAGTAMFGALMLTRFA
jgi:urease accessory protein